VSGPPLSPADVDRLRATLVAGGVAVFPADTVYGLGCHPAHEAAVRRLYELKGRPPTRPAAVMFFALDAALAALPELESAETAVVRALLPGPLTLLLPNRERRYPLACVGAEPDAANTIGLRVPLLPGRLAALTALELPLLQSSANLSGAPDARTLAQVPASIRAAADIVLDGGDLPGVPSTVLDLRRYAAAGEWHVVREGPLGPAEIESRLS